MLICFDARVDVRLFNMAKHKQIILGFLLVYYRSTPVIHINHLGGVHYFWLYMPRVRVSFRLQVFVSKPIVDTYLSFGSG